LQFNTRKNCSLLFNVESNSFLLPLSYWVFFAAGVVAFGVVVVDDARESLCY
jgi:hypothetical protein